MKEYEEENLYKIIFASMSVLIFLMSVGAFWSRESAFVIIFGIAMLALSLYMLINLFVHKIILDDEYISEKSFLRRKQLLFQDVTCMRVDSISTEIIAGKEKISIGRFQIKNTDELVGAVISKVKDNEGLLFGGDPIVFQSYINDFSENKSLNEYNENKLTDFTFVENAELLENRWLFRVVNLKTSKGTFKITYSGKGLSYDCIFVNDELISKKDRHLWYAPNFSFNYQEINFSINIRVNPWLTIRKFWIEVDNNIVYSE